MDHNIHANIVIVNHGKEIKIFETDSGAIAGFSAARQ